MLSSYSILRRELKNLEEFYSTTSSAYRQVGELGREIEHESVTFTREARRKARREALRRTASKTKAETMLRELIMVRVISALETFLTDIIRDVFVVTKAPFMDGSVKIEMTQEELIANSTQTQILSRIINKETRKLTSGGFNEFIKYYRKRFDIDLSSLSPGYRVLNEYHDRRNILVHRLGQTDAAYRKKYSTELKRLTVDSNYFDTMMNDVSTFSGHVHDKIEKFLELQPATESKYAAKLVIDIHLLKSRLPECLRPDFQFWAEDEYVVMTDILLGTGAGEDGRVRYSFSGSNRALAKLKRYLRVEQKRLAISCAYVFDHVRAERRKSVPRDVLESVRSQLPEQPWPTGIHKKVAQSLGLSNGTVSAAIEELIGQGVFKDQVDGKLVEFAR